MEDGRQRVVAVLHARLHKAGVESVSKSYSKETGPNLRAVFAQSDPEAGVARDGADLAGLIDDKSVASLQACEEQRSLRQHVRHQGSLLGGILGV